MRETEVDEIIQCMPQGRTLFLYFRDRYAALLLSWLMRDGTTVADIKQSRYAGLLDKAPVKEVLARVGGGALQAELFSLIWAEPHEQFLLTLDRWGGEARCWQQTSRTGHNLVLQVNLHDGYRQAFERYVPENQKWRFDSYGHPVLRPRRDGFYRQTLGWVRMDIDLPGGELLIEEIQTAWVRSLRRLMVMASQVDEAEAQQFVAYADTMLQRLGKLWDEALLAAALWFAKEELGINSVWYHTADSGGELKRIKGSLPPRSLYTTLPRRFCFSQTTQQPAFLQRDKSYRRFVRGKPAPRWFHLEL